MLNTALQFKTVNCKIFPLPACIQFQKQRASENSLTHNEVFSCQKWGLHIGYHNLTFNVNSFRKMWSKLLFLFCNLCFKQQAPQVNRRDLAAFCKGRDNRICPRFLTFLVSFAYDRCWMCGSCGSFPITLTEEKVGWVVAVKVRDFSFCFMDLKM